MKNKFFKKWNNFHTIIFDFDGVFTNNKVYINQEGDELIKCDRGDGLAFDILRNFIIKYSWDLEYFILSKEQNVVVEKRAEKLKIKSFRGVSNKEEFIKKYLIKRFGEYEISRNGVIYLGNDLNDLSAIKLCGFSFAPKDAHEIVKINSDIILKNKGGEGFVREAIERIINVQNMSLDQIQEII
ncbi:HAD hydrolase family protein [Prochlorococcus sp. AH-716-K03]|nr:HAD hydrolase family protein [Prochlorococcus sp. AH-716-K03]